MNDKAAMTDKNVPGRYVILQFAQEKVTPESFAANHQPPKKDDKNGQGNQQGAKGQHVTAGTAVGHGGVQAEVSRLSAGFDQSDLWRGGQGAGL